jgi:hypothetical protein
VVLSLAIALLVFARITLVVDWNPRALFSVTSQRDIDIGRGHVRRALIFDGPMVASRVRHRYYMFMLCLRGGIAVVYSLNITGSLPGLTPLRCITNELIYGQLGRLRMTVTAIVRNQFDERFRERCATRRLSKGLPDGLRHASNRTDAPQTHRREERRTGHGQRCCQRDLQDKHRVFL